MTFDTKLQEHLKTNYTNVWVASFLSGFFVQMFIFTKL